MAETSPALTKAGYLDARDLRAPDRMDAGRFQLLPRLPERPVRIDGPRGILDQVSLEPSFRGIERGPGDAEIQREPGAEDAAESALLQIARKPRRCLPVRLLEAGIAVDH